VPFRFLGVKTFCLAKNLYVHSFSFFNICSIQFFPVFRKPCFFSPTCGCFLVVLLLCYFYHGRTKIRLEGKLNNRILRLFVAINFNNETKDKLIALQNALRTRSKRGNFTLSENLHITLSFLGDSDLGQATAAKKVIDSLHFDPFAISIENLGCFKRDRGDLWWAGVNGNKPLLDLQRRLADGLANVGFEPEKRKYSPHVTLVRQVITDAVPWPIEPFGETIDKINLMKSERINGKSTYTSI